MTRSSRISPRPLVAQILHSWKIEPSMTFDLLQDVEDRIWIRECTPVGSHFWTLDQAPDLPHGPSSGAPLREAIAAGRAILAAGESVPSATGQAVRSRGRRQPVRAGRKAGKGLVSA